MFFLLPVGVEGAHVRLPLVSLGILLLCLFGFTTTYLLPERPMGISNRELEEVYTYWQQHPYLEMPQSFLEHFIRQSGREKIEALRREAEKNPLPEEREEEQRAFTAKLEQLVQQADHGPMRRYGLVGARGFAQVGWFTHMFLHFGWLHLIGNMLFFYIVAPLLEDAWGRARFAAFFVVGGLVAAFAHFMMVRGSYEVMAGASGAVAACMGAFTVRFARRKISLMYIIFLFIRFFTGTWKIPAWICGGVWFFFEVMSLLNGNTEGVAVMAHVGGFAFGAVLALGMQAAGMDKTLVSISEAHSELSTRDDALGEAQAALLNGNFEVAKAKFVAILKTNPHHVRAEAGLIRLGLQSPHRANALNQLERLLVRLLKANETYYLPEAFLFCWPAMKPSDLKPALAFQVARAFETANLRDVAEALYVRAGDEPGLVGAKALLRALELRIDSQDNLALGRPYVTRLEARPDLLHEHRAKLTALAARVPTEAEAPAVVSGLELNTVAARPVRPQPKIMRVVITAMSDDGLAVKSASGQTQSLPWKKILGIAAGQVDNNYLVDLVIHWGDAQNPAAIVRLEGNDSGLASLFPALQGRRLFSQFASEAQIRSGATGLPDTQALHTGDLPVHPNLDAWMQSIYGAA
ncbi:MAG: rhomboid family intramembrane serine protease [Myxococcaceae bacterium]|nr:rhomboid family intramembrane serine protease [Myxococcaceae bacterium]